MSKIILVVVVCLCVSAAVADVHSMPAGLTSLDVVSVGNIGNTGEVSGDGTLRWGAQGVCGAVGYEYNIGKYEVTAGQYTQFLNAVAGTDTYGLYNPSMWSSSQGCKIERTGSVGSYGYSVSSEMANRPVNYVSWGDAARFTNWLHNNQPTGAQDLLTTENGAYFLAGAATDAALMAVNREADWKWAIPSEDEWYKAAFHENDGDTGNYFDYATGSNSINAGSVNYAMIIGHSTDVGSYAFPSPYGTYDQSGNVWEWNETPLLWNGEMSRGWRNGSFADNGDYPNAMARLDWYLPTKEDDYRHGFRVVSQVPEPATLSLLVLGGMAVLRRGKA